MNEPISGTLGRLTTECGKAVRFLHEHAQSLARRVLVQARRLLLARADPSPSEATTAPIAGALVKLTSESSKVILAIPERGRALVARVPEPVQLELKKLSAGGAHVCREIFAGILVIGLVVIVLGYGRLARG